MLMSLNSQLRGATVLKYCQHIYFMCIVMKRLMKMKTCIFTTYERLLFPSFGLSVMSDDIVSNVGVALSKQSS